MPSRWSASINFSLRTGRSGQDADAEDDRRRADGDQGWISRGVLPGTSHGARRVALLDVRAGVDFLQGALDAWGLQKFSQRPDRERRGEALDDLVALVVPVCL